MRIVSFPEHVCFEHAVEFWTGLLVYARHPSDRREESSSNERRTSTATT
jgi:hypothetical protein